MQASAVIIVTSTYNGTPPDNALDFVRTSPPRTPSHSGDMPSALPPSPPYAFPHRPSPLLCLRTGFLEKGKEAVAEVFGGVRFAVFGCGNTQWARTYQRIPLLIDQALAEAGGQTDRPPPTQHTNGSTGSAPGTDKYHHSNDRQGGESLGSRRPMTAPTLHFMRSGRE